MMKSIRTMVTALSCCLFANSISAQHHKGPINWMSFEQAVAKSQVKPKKIFIDIYTEWCGWCKRMDATTFKDSIVTKYMSDNFYSVKLDAETRDTIRFFDKQFIYQPEHKANELAISLLSSQMTYPSFVLLDEKFALLSPIPGYQTPDQLMRVIRYFGDKIYLTKKWDDYSREVPNRN